MLFYSDVNRLKASGPSKANPIVQYAKHYANLLELQQIVRNGNFLTKAQALKEMLICERKLAHWQRHDEWDVNLAVQVVAALKQGRHKHG